MTGAILGHADLNHADLIGADLSNAVLESANLHSVVVGFRSAPGNLPKDFPASPAKHAAKPSIMPLASRHLERETASTIVNQQPTPRSCVNPGDHYPWKSSTMRP